MPQKIIYNLLKLILKLFQVLQVGEDTSKLQLVFLKKEVPGLNSVSVQTSWETTDVDVKVELKPIIDQGLSFRKTIYRFQTA